MCMLTLSASQCGGTGQEEENVNEDREEMMCSHLQPSEDPFWLNEEYQSYRGVILQPTHMLYPHRGRRALAEQSKWLVSRNVLGEMQTKESQPD